MILFRQMLSLLLCIRKEYYVKNLSRSCGDGVVCVSRNLQHLMNESLCPTLRVVEAVAQDIILYAHFHISI